MERIERLWIPSSPSCLPCFSQCREIVRPAPLPATTTTTTILKRTTETACSPLLLHCPQESGAVQCRKYQDALTAEHSKLVLGLPCVCSQQGWKVKPCLPSKSFYCISKIPLLCCHRHLMQRSLAKEQINTLVWIRLQSYLPCYL